MRSHAGWLAELAVSDCMRLVQPGLDSMAREGYRHCLAGVKPASSSSSAVLCMAD